MLGLTGCADLSSSVSAASELKPDWTSATRLPISP